MDYVRKGLYKPKRILSDLTNEFSKYVRVNDENELVDIHLGYGDLIYVPVYEQIRNFVYSKKRLKRTQDALNLD